ncbi:MAG: hypothetical protein QW780_05470 [Sulfolobales archaeon]
MRRRTSTGLVLVLTATAALANYFAFTYVIRPDRLTTILSPELWAGVERACFGLVPADDTPGVSSIKPGRPVCAPEARVYESLFVRVNLTPGYWRVRLGSFYSRSPVQLVVLVVVEIPLESVSAELTLYGDGWVSYVPIARGSAAVVHLPSGESEVGIALGIRATSPGVEYFRVGFHVAST